MTGSDRRRCGVAKERGSVETGSATGNQGPRLLLAERIETPEWPWTRFRDNEAFANQLHMPTREVGYKIDQGR